MNLIKRSSLYIPFAIILLFGFITTSNVYAQQTIKICNPEDGRICNPIQQDSIEGFLKSVLEGAIKIGLPIIALAIIYCGFLFVKARGNSEELTKAKDALLYTLIGAAILLGAWALAQLIGDTVDALK